MASSPTELYRGWLLGFDDRKVYKSRRPVRFARIALADGPQTDHVAEQGYMFEGIELDAVRFPGVAGKLVFLS